MGTMKTAVRRAPAERAGLAPTSRWAIALVAALASSAALALPSTAQAQECYWDCGNGYCCDYSYPYCCPDGTCSTTSDCGGGGGGGGGDDCYWDCGNDTCCAYEYPYCCPDGTCSTTSECGGGGGGGGD